MRKFSYNVILLNDRTFLISKNRVNDIALSDNARFK